MIGGTGFLLLVMALTIVLVVLLVRTSAGLRRAREDAEFDRTVARRRIAALTSPELASGAAVALTDILENATRALGEDGEDVTRRAEVSRGVPAPVAADLVAMLTELLDNALAFADDDEEVRLTARGSDDGGVVFEVEDTAGGMSRETMLEANRMLQGAAPPQPVDDGLGLFLVARIAARQGFAVDLSSRRDGTAASVYVPAAVLAGSGAPAPRAAEPSARPRPAGGPQRPPGPGPHRPGDGESWWRTDAAAGPPPTGRPDPRAAAPRGRGEPPARPPRDMTAGEREGPPRRPAAARPPGPTGGRPPSPIFEQVASQWFDDPRQGETQAATQRWESPADPGWSAAERAARGTTSRTSGSLPRREPMANLVPGSIDLGATEPGTGRRRRITPDDEEAHRDVWDTYQRGVEEGRRSRPRW